ncbi:MAG: 2-C-methyl-D-erythritol 2,4-cyclodiphosphate synthase [Oscillospiraceae bacterium]|nr:2-C-methyl-D-erythritol 2,4-cyclodiphosphate synthase [Oscillospiraceae bacterium]
MRIGHGYDVHRLGTDQDLIVGGVNIPHEKGLEGHSDADVLTHAIMDAILGALGAGDIGKLFPDTDEQYKGVSSVTMLRIVIDMMDRAGLALGNLDTTIVAEAPKMAPYIPEMRQILAGAFLAELHQVNIKATTEEGLGFTGDGSGIAAHAVVLLIEKGA